MMKSYCPPKAQTGYLLTVGWARVWGALAMQVALAAVAAAIALLAVAAHPAGAAERPIQLEVEGQPVATDVPPLLAEGRTLVPLRWVAESLGAQVSWDGALKQVTVVSRRETVVLVIGQPEALVNGQPVVLDVPARIVQGRTLIPLRFVAEALGATVEWDGASRTVKVWQRPSHVVGLSWKKEVGAAQIRVTLSDPVRAHEFAAEQEPDRLVLNLTPALAAAELPELPPGDPLLRAIHLEQAGRAVRLTVELPRWSRHRLQADPDGLGYTIFIDYQVLGAEVRVEGQVPQVLIRTDGPVSFQTLDLGGPDRLVVDVAATLSPGVAKEAPVADPGAPWIKRIRAGQFAVDPDVARIVLDLDGHRPYLVYPTDFGLLIRFPPHITGVTWEKLQDRTRITVAASGPLEYRIQTDGPNRLISVTLPDTVLAAPQSEFAEKGAAFTAIRLTQRPGFAGAVQMDLEVPYYLGHELRTQPGQNRLVLDLIASPVHGRVIWIDAGHGGTEPGAISKSGSVEKDLTLEVSLQLQRLLEAAGARVLMTRTADSTVGLYERPRLANAAGAEIFVSIHFNSAASAIASGTETFHWSNHPKSAALARQIQAALLNGLGLADRKVQTREFVVLRETKMPSALAELAFLSNPQEEKLMLDAAWRLKAAEALRDGIFAYFWQEVRG